MCGPIPAIASNDPVAVKYGIELVGIDTVPPELGDDVVGEVKFRNLDPCQPRAPSRRRLHGTTIANWSLLEEGRHEA